MPDRAPAVSASLSVVRVRVFVDFWNFQLGVRHNIGPNFQLDWKKLGPWFASEAGKLILTNGDSGVLRYEGMHVYLSFDPRKPKDAGLKNLGVEYSRSLSGRAGFSDGAKAQGAA